MIVGRWYVQHDALWYMYVPLCVHVIFLDFLLSVSIPFFISFYFSLVSINQTKVHDISLS